MKVLPNIANFFLPHTEGKGRSRALSHSALAYYIGLLFALSLFFKTLPKLAPGVLGFTSYITSDQIVSLTNKERSQVNLPLLTFDARLAAAAQAKGEDMLADNYWSHESPTGKTPWDFILSQGYDYIYAGENLAKDFAYGEDALKAWMNSPTHKANIINPDYENIGVAVVKGDFGGEQVVLVVQMFGTEPISKPTAQIITNKKPEGSTLGSFLDSSQTLADMQNSKAINSVPNSNQLTPSTFSLNSFKISKELSIGIIGFIMVLLIIDAIFVRKKGILRLAGHNIAHFLIIIVSLAGILGSSGGSIL